MRAVILVVLVAACGGDGKKAEEPRPIVANEPAPEPEPTPAPATQPSGGDEGEPTPRAVSGGPLGIPECDHFVRLYRICISQMPGADEPTTRDALEQAVIQMEDAFRQMANDPAQRGSLAQTCRDMPAQIGQSLEPMCPGVWPAPAGP